MLISGSQWCLQVPTIPLIFQGQKLISLFLRPQRRKHISSHYWGGGFYRKH